VYYRHSQSRLTTNQIGLSKKTSSTEATRAITHILNRFTTPILNRDAISFVDFFQIIVKIIIFAKVIILHMVYVTAYKNGKKRLFPIRMWEGLKDKNGWEAVEEVKKEKIKFVPPELSAPNLEELVEVKTNGKVHDLSLLSRADLVAMCKTRGIKSFGVKTEDLIKQLS